MVMTLHFSNEVPTKQFIGNKILTGLLQGIAKEAFVGGLTFSRVRLEPNLMRIHHAVPTLWRLGIVQYEQKEAKYET